MAEGTAPASYVLGMNGKAMFGASPATSSAGMTEIGNIRDVTLTLESGEADITTRGNSGWRATAPTLRTCTAEFEMQWLPGDAAFNAIQAAFMSNSTIGLAFLDGTGGQGPVGDFAITNFSRGEALEEAMKVSVTAKLAKFAAWEGGGA